MGSVYSGMLDEFGVLAYGRKNEATLQFLQNRYEDDSRWAGALTEYGQQWRERGREIFNNTNGAAAMRYARGVLRKVQNVFQPNAIRPLWNVHDIQHSPAVMHRYLMANPTARNLWQNQRIAGFPSTYVDHNPGTIGREHYDFRRVTNGVMFHDGEHDWRISRHIGDELVEGDRELEPEEKDHTVSAWDIMNWSFTVPGGDDCTSEDGGKL